MDQRPDSSFSWPDDLPNDLALLKERLARQNSLLGGLMLEVDILRDENRYLKRKNRALRELIWPLN